MKPKSAFTLIEVLIVILILGILTTVAIPQFEGMIIRAKLAEIFPMVAAIAKAEELYFLEHGVEMEVIPEEDVDFFFNQGLANIPKEEELNLQKYIG